MIHILCLALILGIRFLSNTGETIVFVNIFVVVPSRFYEFNSLRIMTKRYIIYPTISLPCSDNITSFAHYLMCDQFKWCPCISWTNVIRITPVCCQKGLNLIGNREYNNIKIIFNKYSPYKSLDGTSGEVSMILADGPGPHFLTWFNFDASIRKHQSSSSQAFVRWIQRGPVNSPHQWPVKRKMFPFDDVIMEKQVLNESLYHDVANI